MLLEREGILQRLTSLLDEAVQSRGSLACLCGEAGIGKSSIARALVEACGDRVRVLWGACEDLSTAEPLGPIAELLHLQQTPQRNVSPSLFADMFEQLTSAPTLVVIEDLHWGDDATLDFVRFAGRRIERAHALLLVTSRDDTVDAQSRLRRALVNVPTGSCVQIDVPLLSRAATLKLAEAAEDGEAVYALTNGNPFLATEVLRSPSGVPVTVRQALLWQADQVSPKGRQAVEAASIFPRRVEAWLLDAMVGEEAAHAIGECVGRGLLEARDGYYAFRHEIARQAIETSLIPTQRAELNATALAYIEARYPDATARLAHHAVEAGDVAAIALWAPRAAMEASSAGAHRQAAQHFQTALAHAETLDATVRADLCERAAFELQLIGRGHDAIALYQTAHDLHREHGDARRAGDALRWVSRLSYNAGDRAKAERTGQEAIAMLEPLGEGPELAMAYANIALHKALKDDSASSIEWAERTIELAVSLGRDDILADAHATLGVATQWRDARAMRKHFKLALELALKLARPELAARIYANSSCNEVNARDAAAAHRWLDAGMAYCRDRDLDSWWMYLRGWFAELLVREGRWDQAHAVAREVIDLPLVSLVLRFPATAALARLRIRTGNRDIQFSDNDLTFEREPQRLLLYAPILAERAWIEEEESEDVLTLLREAAPVAAHVGNIWAAGEIAYWRVKLGDESPTLPKMAAPFQRQLAGDWAGAAALWDRLPAPYERALALLEGDDEARRLGLSILDGLQAHAMAARFRKALRERGVKGIARGPRASTRANAAGLTRREIQVLALIDQGRSNAQIARSLGVAVKTVDHHVSAILTKLNVTSRGEAAATARRKRIIKQD